MLEVQMARFFGVANANDIPHLDHAAKKTHYDETPPAQLAWLFRVRQIARTMVVPKYSEKALRDALLRLRSMLVDPEEARHVPRILMECGVRFVVVEGLPNAKIDGVCFWLDKQSPVIGMSLRFDRIDNFWFVLRHEIEHVLQKHGQVQEIIDAELEGAAAEDSENLPIEERVANAAAADFSIPAAEMSSFVARKAPFFAERDVLGFARRLSVHPGIVVGQIQRRTKRWDFLRRHLVKIRAHVLPSAMVDGWGVAAPVDL
jgi:HTH-type transcriptional regulator/antitoxin HigA